MLKLTRIALMGAICLSFFILGNTEVLKTDVTGQDVTPRANIELRLEGDDWNLSNANGSIQLTGVSVPGTIHTALMDKGELGDPYYRMNDLDYRWVHWDNWTYTKSFVATAGDLANPAVRLVCEGLDTISTVFINNQEVGTSANQFVRYVYDITSAVQTGNNELRIEFQSATQYAKTAFDTHAYRIPPDCPPPEYNPECHANMIRKAACSFCWDWGPAFPTQGIWQGISVEFNEAVKIRDIVPQITRDDTNWLLNVTVHMDIALADFTGKVRVDFPQLGVFFEQSGVDISQTEGKISMANLPIPLTTALAWWPYGYGSQPLYDLTVTLTDMGQVEVDTKTMRTAFRTIEMVEDPVSTGLTLYFKINDVPIYMKGSNWIPVDSFYDRVTEDRYRFLLQSAVDANMNSIRIWGGGVYETDIYYDICDELGILIWQDLMFACNMYPVDPAYLENVGQEIEHQVRRLSRHPSVMAWSGNNENEGALVDNWYDTAGPLYEQYKSDYVTLYIDTVRDRMFVDDTTRPFLPSSPSNGQITEQNGWISENPRPSDPNYGDIHYYNYNDDCLDISIYRPTRYASEYGYQSWPAYETLEKVAAPGDLEYGSPFLIHRQHHPGAGAGTEQVVQRHFNWPDSGDAEEDFREIIYLSQIAQAVCYKAQTEFYRRAQSDPDIRNMGALYWQHNDIWQAPTWATMDFEGNWKLAHHYAAKFFADPIVSTVEEAGVLHVYTVTDSVIVIGGVDLVIQLWSWDSDPGVPLFTWTIPTEVPAASSTEAFNGIVTDLLTEGGCPERAQCLFTLYIQDSSFRKLTPVNPHYLVSWRDAVGLAENPGLQIVSVTPLETKAAMVTWDYQVNILFSRLAAFVELKAVGIAGRFSDNGFLATDSAVNLIYHSQVQVTGPNLQAAIQTRYYKKFI